jgi:transposase-like protein
MVAKLVGPHAITATDLGHETGLAQATLSRWLKEASKLPRKMPHDYDKEQPVKKKQPQEWTPEEKLQIVLEAASLSEGELGILLRTKGIHEAILEEWRDQALAGLRGTQVNSRVQKDRESREMRELKRELRRKDKALAETAALIILKKKVREIWGAEDDDTDPKNDE